MALSRRASNLVYTSVQDVISGLYAYNKPQDLPVLREALEYEREHTKRVSLIRALESAIRRIEKQAGQNAT